MTRPDELDPQTREWLEDQIKDAEAGTLIARRPIRVVFYSDEDAAADRIAAKERADHLRRIRDALGLGE